MDKTRKTLLIFLMIIIQSLIAMAVGIAVLLNASNKEIPANVYAGDIYIGGKSYSAAEEAIEAEYGSRLSENTIKLSTGNADIHEISFTSIDAYVDGESTLSTIRTIKGIGDIPSLINTYFGHYGTTIRPDVKFDESKLRMKLLELSGIINNSPTDAKIYYKDGIIEREADNPGIQLDVNNAVELLKSALSSDPFAVVNLKDGNALNIIDANVTMKDFDEIQLVFGEYSTSIKDGSLSDSIQYAVDSINGTILAPAGDKDGKDGFSFAECLGLNDGSEYKDNGYDQVASTLYAALLTAGIPKDSIIRLPHETAADYIEPGLDAWISGDAGDVKFRNPFNNRLAIFAVKNGSVVTVAICGNRSDKTEQCVIRTETVQEIKPPVFYVEKDDLKPDERIILNPGKKGVSIKVYRNDELISTDLYKAETSIIQIAPGTEVLGNENK